MHYSALAEYGLAGRKIAILAIDPPGRDAAQPVNRFVPAIMIMRDRHPCVRLQRHLEHVEAAFGVVLALQKFQLQRAKIDGLGHGGRVQRVRPCTGGPWCKEESAVREPASGRFVFWPASGLSRCAISDCRLAVAKKMP